ncbi:MAG: hypothetical protein RR426_08785, partial [Oscillospiraceae bacterium]
MHQAPRLTEKAAALGQQLGLPKKTFFGKVVALRSAPRCPPLAAVRRSLREKCFYATYTPPRKTIPFDFPPAGGKLYEVFDDEKLLPLGNSFFCFLLRSRFQEAVLLFQLAGGRGGEIGVDEA